MYSSLFWLIVQSRLCILMLMLHQVVHEPCLGKPALTLNSCLWEVKTTALPSRMMLRIAVHRKRREWGSIPVVGSSYIHLQS